MMSTMRVLAAWVLSVVVILGGYETKCCLQNERAELLRIKTHFSSISDPENGGDQFTQWDENSNCCEWERVKCNSSSGHITHLFLNSSVSPHEAWPLNMNVFNSFPELNTLHLSGNRISSLVQTQGLDMLIKLQDLNLGSNEISHIPDFLLNLTSLQVLDLSSCQVTGKLDARVCNLINIHELYLPNNQFEGKIPDCVWNLSSLQVVDLLGNSFTGSIPSSINLPSLEWLSIQDNNFHGNFSLSSLANHSSLKILMLSNNSLHVQIEDSPISLSKLQLQVIGLAKCSMSVHTDTLHKFLLNQSSLQYVDLSINSLVGSFPTWLLQNNSNLKLLHLGVNLLNTSLILPQNNHPSLVSLDISFNNFDGEIPYHMGTTLSAIKLLQMSHNSFHGSIPSSLGNMTQLEILDLSSNALSGEVPHGLFSHCSHLEFLVLSNNDLSGEIIPSNMNFPSLFVLSLENNNFTGTLKESLKISTVLEYLDISNNSASGEIPSWIGSLSQLFLIALARNQLHGNIPNQICNFGSLQYLDLSDNRFTGEIPSCGCPSLMSLQLSGNSFTGEIPKGLSRATNLRVLDLARNQLLGEVPAWVNLFTNLTVLQLGHNQLQGELPLQLCQLKWLNVLDLSNNSISGTIPSCLDSLSFGAIKGGYTRVAEISVLLQPSSTLFEFKNHYILRDDTERGDFKFEFVEVSLKHESLSYKFPFIFSDIDLSVNHFSGGIPPEVGNLTELLSFLSHNYLSGPLPESLSNLRSMESFDFSRNKLSGRIPSQLVDLNFLEVFNVSYNNLSGRVPETKQFGTFDESSYSGNPLLSGGPLQPAGGEPPLDSQPAMSKNGEPPLDSQPPMSENRCTSMEPPLDLQVFCYVALAHFLWSSCLHSLLSVLFITSDLN